MDAQRGEVYSALYRDGELVDGPAADTPAVVLARWLSINAQGDIAFVGDGALAYSSVIASVLPRAFIIPDVPPLAPAVAQLAAESAARHGTASPDAIRPIYVRRSDAELGRARRAAAPRTR